MTPIDATVAICSLDRRERLLLTIEHLAGQRAPGVLWELLVIDNGSADGTHAAVEARAARGYPVPVRVITEPRRGISRARNRALAEARTEALIFTDDDVEPEPGWLAAHVEALADPTIGLTGGRIEPRFPADCPRWFVLDARAEPGGPAARYDLGPEPLDLDEDPVRPFPFGANFGLRRSAALACGGLREDIGWGTRYVPGEDTELGQRMWRAGHRVRYLPTASVHHCFDPARATLERFAAWQRAWGRFDARMRVATHARGLRRVTELWKAARRAWRFRRELARLDPDRDAERFGGAVRRYERVMGRLLELLRP